MSLSVHRVAHILPIWGVLLIVMSFFLYGTAPDKIGPQGVTAFFIVSYLFVATTIQLMAVLLTKLLIHPKKVKHWRLSYSLILAFFPVIVVGLDSLDQLVLRDILVFIGLAVLLIFYTAKTGSSDSKR